MLNTDSLSLPYPEAEDLPETAKHLQNIAVSLDTLTVPRFSSASTRDSTITAPTDGQAAYLQDEEILYTYKSGYSAWMPGDRPRLYKIKTADETLGDSTTFQDDNHLTGFSYKANTWYIIRGWFNYSAPAGADMKFILIWTTAPSAADSFWGLKRTETAGAASSSTATAAAQLTSNTAGGFWSQGLIEGIVLTAGTSGTVKLQWARLTGGAGGTATMYAGSYLEFIEAF